MADQENIPAKNVSADEDTRTRRTVRLQAVVPAAAGPTLDNVVKTSENAPAAADTRTRLTVKLKPAVPGAAVANAPAATPAAAPVSEPSPAAAPAEEDTRTRVTIKLKPAVSAMDAVPVDTASKAAVPVVKAAAPAEPDTRTRNTVKLKPMDQGQTAAPAGAKVEENTVNAQNTPVEAADDDRTVRIQRPVLKKPMPRPTMPRPAAAVPQPAPVQSASVQQSAQTVDPATTISLTAPSAAPNQAENVGVAASLPPPPPQFGSRPSVLYTVLTLITFVLLAGVATLGVVHYLNFEHKMDIELPGIPFKK